MRRIDLLYLMEVCVCTHAYAMCNVYRVYTTEYAYTYKRIFFFFFSPVSASAPPLVECGSRLSSGPIAPIMLLRTYTYRQASEPTNRVLSSLVACTVHNAGRFRRPPSARLALRLAATTKSLRRTSNLGEPPEA